MQNKYNKTNKKLIVQAVLFLFFVAWIFGLVPGFYFRVDQAQAATLPTLAPNGDIAQSGNTFTTGGSAYYSQIDEDADSGMPDASYISENNGADGSVTLALSDTPVDFASMSTLSIKVYVVINGFSDDSSLMQATVYRSDQSTALTNTMNISTQSSGSGLKTINFTGVQAGDKTIWDGAVLTISWDYTRSMSSDSGQLRAHAVELDGTYTQNVFTTIGDGTDPGNTAIGPGASATEIDRFTLSTNLGTDTITSVIITLGNDVNAYQNVGAVAVQTAAGAAVCSNNSITSNSVTVGSCNLSVTTTPAEYKVMITPKSHAAMPAVPGETYATTARVTDWVGNNNHNGSDTDSATITIDNASPGDPIAAFVSAGSGQNTLNWTDFSPDTVETVVLRRASSAVADVPVEGASYSVGNTIGTSTVACVTADEICTDTGLTNGTAYHYEVFAKDNFGNYSTGLVPSGSPATPPATELSGYRVFENNPTFVGFDGDGILDISPSIRDDSLESFFIEGDYIYLLGNCLCDSDTDTDWRIEKRSKITGLLDENFGIGGILKLDLSASGFDEHIYSAFSDGTYMYLAGQCDQFCLGTASTGTVWVVQKRLLTTGALDPNFGVNGSVTVTDYSSMSAKTITYSNGYLYIGGRFHNGTDYDTRIEKRKASDGALCTAAECGTGFGTNGVVETSLLSGTSGHEDYYDLINDGTSLYLIGYCNSSCDGQSTGSSVAVVLKLSMTTGAFDNNFGGNGIISRDNTNSNDIYRAAALDSTYIYLVGYQDQGINTRWVTEKRLLSTGALDTNFGISGYWYVNDNVSNSVESALDVFIDSGYLYVNGSCASCNVNGNSRIIKAATSNAGVDSAWMDNGSLWYTPGSRVERDGNNLFIWETSGSFGNFEWSVSKRSFETGELDAELADVGNALATENTAATLTSTGQQFRIHLLVHASGTLASGSFKLQYAEMSGSCDTGFSGETYVDVTSGTPIAFYDNAAGTDGGALMPNANDPTHTGHSIVYQTYEEANNFSVSSSVASGSDGLWDFSLYDNGAPGGTAYCFRVVTSDGTALDTYSVIPQVTTLSVTVATISGTVWEYATQTGYGTSVNVKLSRNGGAAQTVGSGAGTGTFSFSSTANVGDIFTIWLDTNSTTLQGSLVVKYGSSCTSYPDCTGLSLWRDQITLANYDATAITNANLAICDNDTGTGCADTDIGFTSNSGTFTKSSAFVNRVRVDSGSWAPGGDVNPGKLYIAGTYTGGSETLTLPGTGENATCIAPDAMPLCVSGTFTANSNSVAFTGGGASAVSGSLGYNSLLLQPTSGTPVYKLGHGASQNFHVNGDFTVGNGSQAMTLDLDTFDPCLMMDGNLTINANVTITKASGGCVIFDGGDTQTYTDNTASKQDIGGVNVNTGGSNTSLHLGSDAKFSKIFINSGNSFDLEGYTLTLTGSGTGDNRPLRAAGPTSASFVHSNGTVIFQGTGETEIDSSASFEYGYGGLTINPAAAATYHIGAGAHIIHVNNFVVGNGTDAVNVRFDTYSTDFRVHSSMTINANAVVTKHASATLTMSADGGTVTYTDNTAAKQDLGNVLVAPNGGNTTFNLASDLTATKFTIFDSSQTVNLSSYTLTLTGTGTGSSRPFIKNGATVNVGTSTVKYVGDGDVEVESGTYSTLNVVPVITAPRTYTTNGNIVVNVNFAVSPDSASTNAFGITLGGSLSVGGGLLVGINDGLPDDAVVNFSTGSNHAVTFGTAAVFDEHTLTANGSLITITAGGPSPINIYGTFDPGTSTVHYTASSETNIGVFTYNNLTIGGTGTFILPDTGLTLRGNLVITNGAAVTKGAGTLVFAKGSTGQTVTDNNAAKQDLGAIQISSNTTHTTLELGSSIKITSVVVDANNALDLNGNTMTITGSGTAGSRPFINSGTFTADSGTVEYAGTSTTTLEPVVYHHLLINRPSGTASYSFGDNTTIIGNFTITSGNVLVSAYTITLASGTVLDIQAGGTLNNGSGTIIVNRSGTGGSAPIVNSGTFTASTGTVDYRGAGETDIAPLTYYNLTLNASSGTPTYNLTGHTTVTNNLTITAGTLNQGASYNLTSGPVSIGASGGWTNTGTGDIVLSGDVTNAGTITIKANNAECGGTDDIAITSSAGGVQRTWSGAGTFTIYNVSATDQAGSITVYSSTLNNTTWTLGACAISISGTTNAADSLTVKVAVNGSIQAQTGTTASSAWTITGVFVDAGQVVTIFIDNVADASESTAVAKYDGEGNMTGLALNTNILSIGSDDDQSLTVADLDLYDCFSDEDIMYAASATALAVQGCSNSYTDETIEILSGDTLTIDSDENLTSDNLTILGTLTQTTTAAIILSGNLTSSGTFNGGSSGVLTNFLTISGGTFTSTSGTLEVKDGFSNSSANTIFSMTGGSFVHNSGTVTLRGYSYDVIDVVSSITFHNLTLNEMTDNSGIAVASGDTLIVEGTLRHQSGELDGPGGIEARGGMIVESTAEGGDGTISFLVTGDQTITTNGGNTASLTINKPSGTVNVATGTSSNLDIGRLTISGGTFTAPAGTLDVAYPAVSNDTVFTTSGSGTFTHNNGTVIITSYADDTLDAAGSVTFNSLTLQEVNGTSSGLTISSGDTLAVLGTFTHASGYVNGPGSLDVQGNMVVSSTAEGGTAAIVFSGSNNQTYTDNGGNEPDGDITINKSGGSLTLASNADWNAANQDVTITQGTLNLSTYTATTAGVLTVGASGIITGTTGKVNLTASSTPLSNSGSLTGGYIQYSGANATVAQTTYHGLILGGAGAYTMPANDFNIRGNLEITEGATVNKGAGKLIFSSGGAQTVNDNTAAGQDLGIIQISANTTNTTLDFATSAKVTQAIVDANQILSCTGSPFYLLGSGQGASRPLQMGAGASLAGGCDFMYTGQNATTDVENTNYSYLMLEAASSDVVYVLPASLTVGTPIGSGDFSVIVGTADAAANNTNLTINRDLYIRADGRFLKGSGTVKLQNNDVSFWTDQSNAGAQDIGNVQLSWNGNGGNSIFSVWSGPVKATTLTIDANQIFELNDQTLILTGNSNILTVNGQFKTETGTVEFAPSQASGTVALPIIDYYNLKLNKASNVFQPADALDVANNLEITAGTLDLDTGDFTVDAKNVIISGTLSASGTAALNVTGDWTNNGTFTHNNGTVTFTPSGSGTMAGSGTANNVFYNLTVTGSGTMLMEAGDTVTVENDLNLSNQRGNPVTINSNSNGVQWAFNYQGASVPVLYYVIIKDAGCHAQSNDIKPSAGNWEYMFDGGNNASCWKFVVRGGGAATGGGPGGSGATGGGGSGGGGGGTDGGSGGEGAEGGGGAGSGGGGASP